MTNALDREAVPESKNPLGFDGIEFIEFATSQPQALGGVLEAMGFRPIARHRSREVELYRQGTMNIIVNAQPADVPRTVQPVERPVISAFAVRVRDADVAFRRALDLGAWEIPVRARAMELNIPAIHGVGESLIYFVDRYDEFSIYDVDFNAIPTVDPQPPAVGGLHFFGLVQYVGADRTADWVEFYSQIFGFTPLPDKVRFGIMPKGLLLQSPCRNFYLQLIEPDDTARFAPMEEHLQRIGLGTPDVMAAVADLEQRGVEFVASEQVHSSERGALTKPALGSVMFELVHDAPRRRGGRAMNYSDIGMDTASLAGSLESKLAAVRGAGFAQVMISAARRRRAPGGRRRPACGRSATAGSRVTGLEALRDFEGLSGQLHAYKVDVAKSMLEICAAIGGRLLLVEASTSTHADADPDAIVARPATSSRCWRFRWASGSPSRDCRGAARRATSPPQATSSSAPTARTSASPSTPSTCSRPACRWTTSTPSTPSRSSWSSSPTTCGRRSARPRSRSRPRRTSASSPARARTATRSPTSSPGSTPSATTATTASTSTTTTTCRCRRRPSPARALRAAEWLGETVLRRALPVPNMERLLRRTGA